MQTHSTGTNADDERRNRSASADRLKRNGTAIWLLMILAECILLGCYCCELNRQLYQHQNPFYDSLSYNEQLFRVMTIARNDGFAASLEEACFSNTTVCLPFLIAASVADWVQPSRMVGIWIQVLYLYAFLASVFYYLTRVRNVKQSTAVMGVSAFVCASCIFYNNGGVSDFRMDLGLCLTFGITVTWYLTAMAKPALWRFGLCGLAAGACCLSRATAPVYLAAALLPLIGVELLIDSDRKQKFIGLGLAGLTTLAVAGWFFISNFNYLYFYYFVWNTDANAKVAWSEALGHFKLARRCIGEPLMVLIVSWLVGALLVGRNQGRLKQQLQQIWRDGDLDWRIFWIGICPIVLMVAKRAGLNPFVCMPAVVGLILFGLIPFLKVHDRLATARFSRFAWICLLVCLLAASARGWRRHQQNSLNRMAAQRQIMDTIIADSRAQEMQNVRFGVMHLTELNTNSLYSTLLFDRPEADRQLDCVALDRQNFFRVPAFSKPAKTDWELIEGESDDEKTDRLVEMAGKRIDYLVVPDGVTAKELQTTAAHNYVNRHLESLRRKVLAGGWEKITGPIQSDDREYVEVYRRLPDRVAMRPETRR